MSIRTVCSCGKTYDLPDDRAGTVVECLECGASIQVPAMGSHLASAATRPPQTAPVGEGGGEQGKRVVLAVVFAAAGAALGGLLGYHVNAYGIAGWPVAAAGAGLGASFARAGGAGAVIALILGTLAMAYVHFRLVTFLPPLPQAGDFGGYLSHLHLYLQIPINLITFALGWVVCGLLAYRN